MRMFFANKELLKGVVLEAQRKAKERFLSIPIHLFFSFSLPLSFFSPLIIHFLREGSSTSIYVPDNMGTWVRSCGKAKRSLSSVILEKGMVEVCVT